MNVLSLRRATTTQKSQAVLAAAGIGAALGVVGGCGLMWFFFRRRLPWKAPQDRRKEVPQQRSSRLASAPTDGTYEPEANTAPERINIVSDEIEAATEEDLWRIIEQEGKVREPEIEAYDEFGRAQSPSVAATVGTESYIDDYPTHFDFRADVSRLVNRIQGQFPWQTYANTYYMHPPVYGRTYEFVSVDFWGGGLSNGRYVGYRGKPIETSFGHQVWNALFYDEYLPNIHWIIWNGWMWTRGWGWDSSPPGPPDSDAGHYNHIHVTYVL